MQLKSTRTRSHPDNPCNGYYGRCLDVKITNLCNGNCAFCIERWGHQPHPAPVESMISMTNALIDYQKVLILGGEPFLYPDLEEYIEGIQDKEDIYITTNGSLFQNDALRRMARYLTAVNISIHHYKQEVNRQIIGAPVDFQHIAEAVDILRGAGVSVRINTNLIKGVHRSAMDLMEMFIFAREIGADGIRFAELQQCPELYLSARTFLNLPEDPFVNGCEHQVVKDGFEVTFRTTCGLCNSFLPAPHNPVRRGSMTKVLYPNGVIYDGWRSESFSTWRSAYNDNCHNGCHSTGGCH